MRIAFISDIHANLEALDVVLDDTKKHKIDRVICLGDIVGYGPDPNACVRRIREICEVTVVGNHDYAALGRIDTLGFNEYARAAVDWTAAALDPESRDYLEKLPLTVIQDDRRLVHSSPRDPDRWTYILSFEEAHRQFTAFDERLCFVGHSHLPILIELNGEEVNAINFTEDPITLKPGSRYIANVGSVGQPRDRDPRSGYLIYDDEANTVWLRRTEYAVGTVQEKIVEAGLPEFLARRLASGV